MKNPKIPLRRALLGAIAGASLLAAMPAAMAQAWPTKPVRIVIGAPAGGTSDVLARMLADGMQKAWGQPVIVDAKPGGAGTIGVNDLMQSPADGHTLYLAVNAAVTEIPHVIKVRYDPFKDLKPLVDLGQCGLVFVGNASLPAKNVAEVISYVKANPGKVSYASYSAGTISHTMGLGLNKAAGIDMTHVPYKGSPPALQDVMGGHVALMFDGPATALPMLKGGRLKAFAVSGPKRNPALPNVPTFAEQGYPMIDDVAMMILWIRPDVPADVQAKVRDTALKVMAQPAAKAKLLEFGFDQGGGATPEELSEALRKAYDKQGATLRALGVKPQDLGS
ncbi:tripartite tricarboxylate transporter substrate binding protein [Ottowia sp.]|jgi:tripartite-type tricarboxylate transporter receptor subunit TctC|uniref:Bug family tripartite tricarboxylate transporter substrate binding protein n=1 Tax=Ottowia sp. TaxID=1898956 RepID=UPI0025F573BE|nr:tripartite tricarboxylate transporter substrate binding protein [Ottowia sp.]MBK6613794.1 tripartite tricarboxylate transporter substrate binding protein [Ottowia sp.]MBK6748391.1 tripartite tricarboxylate transporter substrate binding protein [Ottowia sp.]